MNGGTQRKSDAVAGNSARVQGVTGAQSVKAASGILWSLVVASADAAAQTVTVLDGATTKIVLQIPAHDTRVIPLALACATNIQVTPSAATLDVLALYD